MQTIPSRPTPAVWVGRVLSALAIAFMIFDGGIKLVPIQPVIDTMRELGWPTDVGTARLLGVIGLVCTAIYAVPATACIGAVLLTGYLGGAIATQVRIDAPLLSHVFFSLYVAAFVWGGLWLRDARLRAYMMR